MHQKNAFGQKKFQISCTGLKVALKNCQNGTDEPMHEIWNFFWPQAIFWSIMKMTKRKKSQNMSQGPQNTGFIQDVPYGKIAEI